jgi:hypothetical protein
MERFTSWVNALATQETAVLIRMLLAAALVVNASAAAAAPVSSLSLVNAPQSSGSPPAPRASGGGVKHGGLIAIGLLVSIAVFVGVMASQSDEADSN